MALIDPGPRRDLPGAGLGEAIRPKSGEHLCGDQVGWWSVAGRVRLALADGLGHGPEAYEAAIRAMLQIRELDRLGLDDLFARCDEGLARTRGVALAVVDVIPEEGAILHAAVGNVRTLIVQEGKVKRLAGARGIVGAGFGQLRLERLAINPGDWIALFSDGIRENASLAESLTGDRASDQLAEQLLSDWASDRDDASLLIYRHD